jgi:midasin (ATPase involved in ribosome maturation)
LATTDGQAARTAMLSRLLYNTYRYYAQFARPVGEAVAALREPIARQLSEHVQLAKWEDHSYFALKVSSERNGKTLRKFATQFAAALCQPAINVLKVCVVWLCGRVRVCICVCARPFVFASSVSACV